MALLMATLAAGGAFAQIPLSAGIGGTFTADAANMSWTSEAKQALIYLDWPEDIMNMRYVGGGFFAYFDAAYVMASLGLNFYNVTFANRNMQKEMDALKAKVTRTEFNIGIYGKFPFNVGSIILFPILGADIKLVLAETLTLDGEKYQYTNADDEEANPLSELSCLWVKTGVGMDIPLGEKMYLRPIFLYGLGFNNKEQNDEEDILNSGTKLGTYVNHGVDIKVALGFKF